MKKMMMSTSLLVILAVMTAVTVPANAMSYKAAKNEALFLSDKMAYELNLTDAQYDAVYEINLDYLMSVNVQADVLGVWWDRRNADLRYVLTPRQYEKYVALNHFYRPVSWRNGAWAFHVYSHYTNRGHFFKARPTVFVTYRGGHNKVHGSHYAHMGRPAPALAARHHHPAEGHLHGKNAPKKPVKVASVTHGRNRR